MNTTFEMHGYREFIARLSDAEKRHMPFAAAKALTQTGRQVAVAETGHIEAIFDKPTPFTKRAVGVTPATKATLRTRIFVKDIQAKYLMQEATGGRRGFKTFEEKFAEGGQPQIALPGAGMQLNQYGNMSKAKILRIAKDLNSYESSKRFFKGTPKGNKLPAGIYARTNDNRRITPLIRFATDAVYKKRFEFSAIAEQIITASRYRESRASREFYVAAKQKLEYEQLLGQLINVDEAKRIAFTSFRAIRDSVLNVAARIKDQLAAETDLFISLLVYPMSISSS